MATLVALRRSLLTLRTQKAAISTASSVSDSNILRILRSEASILSEYASPLHPPTQFNSFTVQDRPGEQCITMKSSFGNSEQIKLQINMFDGFQRLNKSENDDDDRTAEDLQLHISLIINVLKENDKNVMAFACSAWPDCLEIHRVYIRDKDIRAKAYSGPNFRNLSSAVQKRFKEYLEERGVNDKLCVFLHEYMMKKERIELIEWFHKVESFVGR